LWLGLGRYGAQAMGYVLGTGFNYITYSRGVFRDAGPAKLRFALSYAGNYLVNLAGLAIVSHFIANPYWAGAVTTMGVVVLNYLVLKKLVFRA
jgi:putative flippase GtrA